MASRTLIRYLLLAGTGSLCWGAPALAQDSGAPAAESGNSGEIIVTAQKRTERLQDVPIPVAVVSADQLSTADQVRLQDYFSKIPGMSLETSGGGRGAPSIAIRGVTTGPGTNPTVGVVIDDVPYGSALSNGGGSYFPDIDPGDLERVEVLRGPQGTLYGASSIGGLLKFVTVRPSLDGVSGRFQAGVLTIENGDKLGYNLRGSINVPVSSQLAIRASAFTRRTPGYIDNPVTGVDGVNEETGSGGRVSLLWKPADNVSVVLSALAQDIDRDGSSDVQPTLGDLQQNHTRGTGFYNRQTRAFSATIDVDLDAANLTSITGYTRNKIYASVDFPQYGGFVSPLFGVNGAAISDNYTTNKFSQEIRALVPLTDNIDWLIGGFYMHERSDYLQVLEAIDPATGDLAGEAIQIRFPTTYEEYAAFTDFTFNFTERFNVQVGGRLSHQTQTLNQSATGPLTELFYGVPSPYSEPISRSSATPFTYLVTPQFKISPNLMVYARFASGYRAGGPNLPADGATPNFAPDRTYNYELGAKGSALDGVLSFDASLYRIDWKNIQIGLVTANGFGYNVNAGSATSQGAELTLDLRPTDGLSITAWGSYSDAEISSPFPASSTAFGQEGDRLPFSSKWSGRLAADQVFQLGGGAEFLIGGAASFVGRREGPFRRVVGPRQILPAYTQFDLRAQIAYKGWTLDVFANNVTDKRGVLAGGVGSIVSTSFNYIQPRTVGVAIGKRF